MDYYTIIGSDLEICFQSASKSKEENITNKTDGAGYKQTDCIGKAQLLLVKLQLPALKMIASLGPCRLRKVQYKPNSYKWP